MPKNGIPDRWENYNPVGNVVGQTRFIAFKVPLKDSLCKKLPEKERFTPSDLISSIDKLGMVIDLTNTYRYYNSAEITDYGVRYKKILCRGRMVPDEDVVNKFFDAVEDFLKKNQNGLIGVHCTHGVNRTGYLVCKYMIDRLEYQADDAIRQFNKARGHNIERKEYIMHLYNSKIARDKSICKKPQGKVAKEYINSNKSNEQSTERNSRNYVQNRMHYERNNQQSSTRKSHFCNSQQSNSFGSYRNDQIKSKQYNGYFYRQSSDSSNRYNYTRSSENSWHSLSRSRSFDSCRTYFSSDQDLDYHQSFNNFETSHQRNGKHVYFY